MQVDAVIKKKIKLKQRGRTPPFSLTRGDYPLVTHNKHKASTITSTQQQKQFR